MKKMVSILMSLVLVISLSACGQGKTENASTNDTQASSAYEGVAWHGSVVCI